MNKEGIARVVEAQQLTAHFKVRGTQRIYRYLGTMANLTQMSEADLVALVRMKVNKEKESGHSGH